MEETMNRAARRAAGVSNVKVRVRNQIVVVPMEHVESYFAHEISREGKWASDIRPIILQPEIERGAADDDWFPKTLARMREARTRHGPSPIEIALGNDHLGLIDVGLIDIIVSFETPPARLRALLSNHGEADRILTENLRHFDSVCAGAFHDQMILATVPHFFRSDGSNLYHFHNLIFGLRQEVRDDRDILGPIDLEPLLRALAKSGPLNVIGCMKQ